MQHSCQPHSCLSRSNKIILILILCISLFTLILFSTQLVRAEAPEATATPTPFENRIEQSTPPPMIFLPIISRVLPTPTPPPPPPTIALFCSNNTINIPDNNLGGISDTITISDGRAVVDLDLRLEITHSWVGDLLIQLSHPDTATSITVIDRPGYPANKDGCGQNDIQAILDDELTLPVEKRCSANPAAIAGIFRPEQALAGFDGQLAAGTWILSVADRSVNDSGKLRNWCLRITLGDPSQIPPPPPPPPTLPAQAKVTGVQSYPQSLPLDCESRVAVDWAAFFGFSIDELKFFNQLPKSDNPDTGFVGNVNGAWGQIPPNDYGVHVEPVVALLRNYGVTANAHHPLSWDGLRTEIAAGRPVYVWTIGASSIDGIPIYYRSSDDHLSVVASYEHTVIVIGYTENEVTILDNGNQYARGVTQFLSSWSALGNMALTASP